VKRYTLLLFLSAVPALCRSNTGELRLTVADPTSHAVQAQVQLVSDGNQYSQTFTTDAQGNLEARRLPYGLYQVQIQAPSVASVSETVPIRSALLVDRMVQPQLTTMRQSVTVHASGALIDPYRAGSVEEMGLRTIENRLNSLPGRSIQDLVNSEPGWLFEGNAVLHPRGSE
jgi:hypothetical protein